MANESVMHLIVTTPEGVRFDHHATAITVPTTMGPYTFLANHTPIIMPLVIGPVNVVRVERPDRGHLENSIAISDGIVEVRDNEVNVVVNTAERARDIDLTRAEKAKANAEAYLKEEHTPNEIARVRISLNKAINRIGIAEKYRR
ncbi:ATP synthase F1 subunit epsilon [Atopobacter sp. AH10]|uniref:ATP synthase F1 subunit epsilon n=1 Tax=Atopobacter sp. AH10 TaxID=2315861 RepID=UPI000EF1C690|nr:ATP synthase F1 subunit epsilon [Atopobacter sp. AH10]RLK64091.1 ATP synthase F1 subunit epsilon [Atopobacter sp. AH10]